jgi:RNA-directed DNA polymerase
MNFRNDGKTRSLIELSAYDARSFLLKPRQYCTVQLPTYFNFGGPLAAASEIVERGASFYASSKQVGDCEDVNHRLLSNKDGAYSWREFQIIHPVMYVRLVHMLTEESNWKIIRERFTLFRAETKITCQSIPQVPINDSNVVEATILNWWDAIEQESIRLSLQFKHLALTDIADCYGSLYTHSIAWALVGKVEAKNDRNNKKSFANNLDKHMQFMQDRQTNGIPQGNVASDLIAETVLGYADYLLGEALKKAGITDYKILRYRDDYRIFTNTPELGKLILLHLTQVLANLNFKLNSSKTFLTDDVVTGSIKPDKLHWLKSRRGGKDRATHLLRIRELGREYPDSGQLRAALSGFRKKIETLPQRPDNNDVLIALVCDVMRSSPSAYPTTASILSKLLWFESHEIKVRMLDLISKRFEDVPNIGILDIWLQRISLEINPSAAYAENLCKVVQGESKIWNSEWMNEEARLLFESRPLIDTDEINNLPSVIPVAETERFLSYY